MIGHFYQCGLNVMMAHCDDNVIIFVDNRRFSQR